MEKYGMNYYENSKDELAIKIIRNEKVTYSVLISILNMKCKRIFTDNKRIIICHSCLPWPVWIWTVSDISEGELQQIGNCLQSEFSLENGYSYNLSYELLQKLIRCGLLPKKIRIKANLLSYKCSKLKNATKKYIGMVRLADENDIEYVAYLIHHFVFEAEKRELSKEICLNSAQEKIKHKLLYILENENSEIAAIAAYSTFDGMGKISLVYTLPQFRKNGYAANLVCYLTHKLIKNNFLPILYTDADYVPSNNCYKKLGYEKVGSLCTVCSAVK